MSKTGQMGAGNAAEKLRLTRAMPRLSLAAPLPVEGAPAVAVSHTPPASTSERAGPRRGYRISTFMTDEAGARLTRLVAHFKATQGRRCGAPIVIERALLALERELGLDTAD
jgi:hypothetical protein